MITSASHGLSGKDSVRIANGTYTIVSGKDGIHAQNKDDSSSGSFIWLEVLIRYQQEMMGFMQLLM